MNKKFVAIGFVVVALLTVLSYLFIDQRVALWVQRYVFSISLLRKYVSDIPDLLLLFVLTVAGSCWALYLFFAARHRYDRHRGFALLCGLGLPLAFLVKMILQYVFGRYPPRFWLFQPGVAGLHWFQSWSIPHAFPSGHMTVITAFAAMLYYFYPRYRAVYLTALVGLGVALVMTNYHFVSDVIAGAYVGLVTAYAVDAALRALSPHYRRHEPSRA
ncbi:MAG: phosphatase PAP2 family protein [Gammaproteobacteria bacterium]